MKTKLSTLERRAKDMCDEIKDLPPGVTVHITVEWKKSAMYGLCPSITWNGQKVAHVSGCGYCKLSTVLALALCYLIDDAYKIALFGGAGVQAVQEELLTHGWCLSCVSSGKTWDVYTLERVGK